MGQDPELTSAGLTVGQLLVCTEPWGSCGLPREGTSTPSAGETGADLAHRVGFGAPLPKGQSTEGGRRWSSSRRTRLPGPGAELHPLCPHPGMGIPGRCSPGHWAHQGCWFSSSSVPTDHRLSPGGEWGASPPPAAPPCPGQGMPGSAPLCSPREAQRARQAALLCRCRVDAKLDQHMVL